MKRTENFLYAAAEEQWQAMLGKTQTGFFLVDARGRVLQHNKTFAQQYYRLTGNILSNGINITAALPESRQKVVLENIQRAFAGEELGYEVFYTKPSEMWLQMRYCPAFDTRGRLVGVSGSVDDITERKKLEETARFKDAQFVNAFHYSNIGMALVSPTGGFIDVNPALTKLTGYNREELLAKTFQDITHPDDLHADLGLLTQMLEKKIESYQLEKRYYHKNGAVVWVMLTVSLVWHGPGVPAFFISQIVDITATKALIKELETKNNALDFTAQQLEEFTHIAGHNLRGNAGNIKLMADVLNLAAPEELPVWTERLRESAEMLLSSLDELLQFSRVQLSEEVALENCNIREACAGVLAQAIPPADKEKVVITYSLAVENILYHRIYLESILYNLLSNAYKYRKRGTTLYITIKTFVQNGRQTLSVTDNGIGFDAIAGKDKIFTLNGTFHKGYNSKGIGLFITKAQVQKMGGSIAVESAPGAGTTFTITLEE